jgi:hypothetical protein
MSNSLRFTVRDASLANSPQRLWAHDVVSRRSYTEQDIAGTRITVPVIAPVSLVDADIVLTATQIVEASLREATAITAGRNVTLPTSASIVTLMNKVAGTLGTSGCYFDLFIPNTSGLATRTVVLGAGMTSTGSLAILTLTSVTYRLHITNSTAGAEVVHVNRLG